MTAWYASQLKSFAMLRCAVTVEPMLFLYFLSSVMSSNISTNLLLYKACDPDATAAPDLSAVGAHCRMEQDAQRVVSSVNAWKHVVQEALTVLFVMFAGPWSDNHGRRRRPLMYVPVLGQMLCDTLNVLFSVTWIVPPLTAGLVQSATVSLTGSYHCFFIGMFAYLSDITDDTNRTMRIGFASAVLPLSATVGALSAGYLNVRLGFAGAFVTCIAVNVLALCLGLLLVYDTSVASPPPRTPQGTFDLSIVVASLRTVVVKRDGHKRLVLLLMMVASPLTGASFIGKPVPRDTREREVELVRKRLSVWY